MKRNWTERFTRFLVGGMFEYLGYSIIKYFLTIKTEQAAVLNIFIFILGVGFVTLGFFIIFPQLHKLIPKKSRKCKICGKPGYDVLVLEGSKSEKYFCRYHLLKKFKGLFISFPNKIIVFHPEQERKYCSTMYPYYPQKLMVSSYFFAKDEAETVRSILSMISGNCNKCGENKGQVAYFRKGLLKWEGSGPSIKKTTIEIETLCPGCTFEKIETDLRNNKENYSDNGIVAPYLSEGVFVNTFL